MFLFAPENGSSTLSPWTTKPLSPDSPSLQSASEMSEAGLPTPILAAIGKDSPGAYSRTCLVSSSGAS
ncbi:hypothetical protein KJE20_00554 [Pyrenophora tritici-repentis]|nr:hypothetical protein KJE20_00554 [Pyrenophora tritici-repentis]